MRSSLFGREAEEDQFVGCLFPNFIEEDGYHPLPHKRVQQEKDPFNLSRLEGISKTDIYMSPLVQRYEGPIPESLITFTKARALMGEGIIPTGCACFYIPDESFMCLVNNPDNYVPMLSRLRYVIGPDFSVKRDMPCALQIYNAYLNKLLTSYLQTRGVCMIPNIVWSIPRLYDTCFDGFPTESVIAINSMGIKGNKDNVYFWLKGYREALKRLKPKHILRYGEFIDGEVSAISTYYPNEHLNRMRYGR